MKYSGKLYGKITKKHFDTGWKSKDVDEMIKTLIEVHRAIKSVEDDAFGFAEMEVDNKLIKYPMKDELLNNIEKALNVPHS